MTTSVKKKEQQLESSKPVPLTGRLQPSIYTSSGYETVGEPACHSEHRSSIDTSVDSDEEEVPDPVVTSANYVTAADTSTALGSSPQRGGTPLSNSPVSHARQRESSKERIERERERVTSSSRFSRSSRQQNGKLTSKSRRWIRSGRIEKKNRGSERRFSRKHKEGSRS